MEESRLRELQGQVEAVLLLSNRVVFDFLVSVAKAAQDGKLDWMEKLQLGILAGTTFTPIVQEVYKLFQGATAEEVLKAATSMRS